jgi:thiamine kinase-like enzyme
MLSKANLSSFKAGPNIQRIRQNYFKVFYFFPRLHVLPFVFKRKELLKTQEAIEAFFFFTFFTRSVFSKFLIFDLNSFFEPSKMNFGGELGRGEAVKVNTNGKPIHFPKWIQPLF